MRPLAGVAAALAVGLAACAPQAPRLPIEPVAASPAIVVRADPTPLDPTDPSRERVGAFSYAGGLILTSPQTGRLHGLSDLKVWPDGRLLAVGDQADLLEARLVLDVQGRLAGLSEARLSALKDATGADVYAGGPREYDSEGVAVLSDGALLVSFEQHDRILLYPAGGGPPRLAPTPDVGFTHNKGMEALAAASDVGPDAYRVGLEDRGWVFLCRVSTRCEREGDVVLDGLELVAMESLPGGRMAYLLRSFTPMRGNVVRLKIVDRAGREIDAMEIARPMTVDNFEGLAAVPRPDGGARFYLVSDDNFGTYNGLPTHQRTLLLAFDWTPLK